MNILTLLTQKMKMPDVQVIVAWTQEDSTHLDILWSLVHSDNRRVAVNVLWVLTHLPDTENNWLQSHQEDFADMLLTESETSKKRILLQLLKVQEFNPGNLRSDLLDFCLSKINAECEPYAVRCFSLYVAFRMCRHYPELIAELEQYLDLLSQQQLSPGLKSALRQTRTQIACLKRKSTQTSHPMGLHYSI